MLNRFWAKPGKSARFVLMSLTKNLCMIYNQHIKHVGFLQLTEVGKPTGNRNRKRPTVWAYQSVKRDWYVRIFLVYT